MKCLFTSTILNDKWLPQCFWSPGLQLCLDIIITLTTDCNILMIKNLLYYLVVQSSETTSSNKLNNIFNSLT